MGYHFFRYLAQVMLILSSVLIAIASTSNNLGELFGEPIMFAKVYVLARQASIGGGIVSGSEFNRGSETGTKGEEAPSDIVTKSVGVDDCPQFNSIMLISSQLCKRNMLNNDFYRRENTDITYGKRLLSYPNKVLRTCPLSVKKRHFERQGGH